MDNNDMNFGPLVLVDEEGNEMEFEYYDTIEYEGKIYVALIPVDTDADADDDDEFEDYEEDIIILRVEKDENGIDSLVTIDDDDEYDAVYEELQNAEWDDLDFAEEDDSDDE